MPPSVLHCLEGKNVLVTGATGFLGKCFVEKLLRSVPNSGNVYLLIRPKAAASASDRLFSEVVTSKCFDRCREEIPDFNEYARKKLIAVPGELTRENAGISDDQLAELYENVNVIIHCAANIDFNDRLDRAIELNVLGSLTMLEIAKKCKNMFAHVHVSTCYVNSNRTGTKNWIDEKIYPLGFDPQEILSIVDKMNIPQLEEVGVTGFLREFPNTYTFTKAIAENLLVRNRGTTPLAIVRPAIVGAAWEEPFPGWIEGISGAGALFLSAGLGVLKFIPGNPTNIGDVIPVDYVINSMMAVLPAVWRQNKYMVCHAASSGENPLQWGLPCRLVIDYFKKIKPSKAIGPPSFTFMRTPQNYQIQFFLRYSVLSALGNTISMIGTEKHKKTAANLNKLVWRVRVLVESFKHFTANEWIFDNRVTRALGKALPANERELFPLSLASKDFLGQVVAPPQSPSDPRPQLTIEDISRFEWVDYIQTFCYGLCRFILDEDVVPVYVDPNVPRQPYISLSDRLRLQDNKPATTVPQYLVPDAAWAYQHVASRPHFPAARNMEAMRDKLLTAPAVQDAIAKEAIIISASKRRRKTDKSPQQLATKRARDIIFKMVGGQSWPVLGGMAVFFRKIWRQIYESVQVDSGGVERIREAASRGPVVYVPTHRSYIDFLVVSYMCMACGLPMPFIAAGEDFLGIMLVRWIFRRSGAFFIRRAFGGDQLYSAIFNQNIEQLLADGQSIEFFIEGTRSRSGKMLHPKTGLLASITDTYFKGTAQNVTFVPIAINYEKTMESGLYSDELMGSNKIQESLRSLLRSARVLVGSWGAISLKVGELITMDQFAKTHAPDLVPRPLSSAPPSSSSASSSTAVTVSDNTSTVDAPSNARRRKEFNRKLSYHIAYELCRSTQVMPLHLVASLMLMYRQGITRQQLVAKVDWLIGEVRSRGGDVAHAERRHRLGMVNEAVDHLPGLVVERQADILEPAINQRRQYGNMLSLGHYRNKILHLFFVEGLFTCALYSLWPHDEVGSAASPTAMKKGINKSRLIERVEFLHSLLYREVIINPEPGAKEDFNAALDSMIERGILLTHQGENKDGSPATLVEVASTPMGEASFSFLCSLLWPLIDSYYVAVLILFSLQPDRTVDEAVLLQRTQWLATTLYHESMLCFYESCNKDTLNNAFERLQEWKVIKLTRQRAKKTQVMGKPRLLVQLQKPYHQETALTHLLERIEELRKPPTVRRQSHTLNGQHGLPRNLIADVPILAKL